MNEQSIEKQNGIAIIDYSVFTTSRKVFHAVHCDVKKKDLDLFIIPRSSLQSIWKFSSLAIKSHSPVHSYNRKFASSWCFIYAEEEEKTCEIWVGMTRSTFEINTDASGRRFFYKDVD